MRNLVYVFSLFIGIYGLQAQTKRDSIVKYMRSNLVISGKNPVHSIQTYISNEQESICEAVGFADAIRDSAAKLNQFKIASITKTMTAAVVMQLQEEGRLNINDHISKYLKDVPFVNVYDIHILKGIRYGNDLTIKHLLEHSSGLADLFTDSQVRFYLNEYLNKNQEWNPQKLMIKYFRYRLNKKAHFAPGNGFFYSDVNYFLLGIIIEKITGKSLAQNYRQRIFEPLGMKDSYLEYCELPSGTRKLAHSFFGRRDISRTLNTSYDWAGGGVISTTKDLSEFVKALFNGQLFKKDSTIIQMITMKPHPLKSGRISYYGLGIYQYSFNGDIYYGHGGFWGSLMAWCPAKKIAFCGSINQVNSPFDTYKFIENLIKIFNS